MKVIIYICLAISIVYLGYITGKKEPHVKVIEKIVVKTIKQQGKVRTKPENPSISTNSQKPNKPLEVGAVLSTPDLAEEFTGLPNGRAKFVTAEKQIDEFLNNNPDSLNDEDADLYAEQIKYIFDWSKPDKDQTIEWVYKLSRIKSAEFKTDIFEYMVQARLISVKELEDIVITD